MSEIIGTLRKTIATVEEETGRRPSRLLLSSSGIAAFDAALREMRSLPAYVALGCRRIDGCDIDEDKNLADGEVTVDRLWTAVVG